MIASHAEDKNVSSKNYLVINIWAGKIGHPSLEVFSEKGHDYLSYWPLGAPNEDIHETRPSDLLNFEDDCFAERPQGQTAKREPDGIYKLALTKEQANAIYASVLEIKEKVKNKETEYTIINQDPDSKNSQNNYNCSGVVEKILSKNLWYEFEGVTFFHPLRVASAMIETKEIEIIKHDVKALRIDLPSSQDNENSIRSSL